MNTDYNYFMEKAIQEAEKALNNGEFPVGSVLVYNNEILVASHKKSTAENELDHSEIETLRELALLKDKNIKKEEILFFTTLEPCLMCLGAIVLSGIKNIVYAYEDVMGGAANIDLKKITPIYDKNVKIVSGILREKSLKLFKKFFKANEYLKDTLLAEYTLSQK